MAHNPELWQPTADDILAAQQWVQAHYAGRGFRMRGEWQVYQIEGPGTNGWMNTFSQHNGRQVMIWINGTLDQYNIWEWDDTECLDLPVRLPSEVAAELRLEQQMGG